MLSMVGFHKPLQNLRIFANGSLDWLDITENEYTDCTLSDRLPTSCTSIFTFSNFKLHCGYAHVHKREFPNPLIKLEKNSDQSGVEFLV